MRPLAQRMIESVNGGMGMPRERQIVLGLGAVAVAGLMFDKVVLGPSESAAAETEVASADPAGPVRAAAAAVGAKVETKVRDAMMRALEDHVSESLPQMDFGPDAAWLTKAVAAGQPGDARPASEPEPTPDTGFLPGLSAKPKLSLVMPTRDGGIAVIDGHRLRAGQTHPDGYQLVSVDARSVTIALNGSAAVISLPSPGN
jgi:hypothetical protein|tara:strand:- start:22721 stop:23323 length:603 start_codon:yes stop_codon:yes gene_type:complete